MHGSGRDHVLGIHQSMMPEVRFVVRARTNAVAAGAVIVDPEFSALLGIIMEFENPP